jgi:hypothetical protein
VQQYAEYFIEPAHACGHTRRTFNDNDGLAATEIRVTPRAFGKLGQVAAIAGLEALGQFTRNASLPLILPALSE